MYKALMCIEEKEYKHFVNTCRHYAGNKISKCLVFNQKDYKTEIYKEKEINGIKCIIFGWTNNELYSKEAKYDLVGIQIEKENLKCGYILLEFEDNMLISLKNKSIYRELELAINLNKIERDDFNIALGDEEEEEEEEIE